MQSSTSVRERCVRVYILYSWSIKYITTSNTYSDLRLRELKQQERSFMLLSSSTDLFYPVEKSVFPFISTVWNTVVLWLQDMITYPWFNLNTHLIKLYEADKVGKSKSFPSWGSLWSIGFESFPGWPVVFIHRSWYLYYAVNQSSRLIKTFLV